MQIYLKGNEDVIINFHFLLMVKYFKKIKQTNLNNFYLLIYKGKYLFNFNFLNIIIIEHQIIIIMVLIYS